MVQERTVEIEVRTDGTVLERTRLRVLLGDRADLDAWSRVVVPLDENRTLRSIVVSARTPDGATIAVGKGAGDTHELAGPGELHASRKARSVQVPRLPVGALLSVDHEVAERPYFPGGLVALQGAAPVERLRVTVRGPAGLRFRVDGEAPGVATRHAPGSVEVTGTAVAPAVGLPHAPASHGAVLRYAWGPERDWPGVGAWYDSLLAAVPRGSAAVRQAAVEAGGGAADARVRLGQALAYVRRRVRYVAVEVGIGGYRPSASEATLARGWGDCKDKALLLVEILESLGIASHPALIALAPDDRIDRAFPSPHQFNHVIVAVPAAALGRPDGLPSAGGFVFVDPTQEAGGPEWLAPGTQGQDALVVRAGGSSLLVATPVAPRQEVRRVVAALTIAPDRTAAGTLRIEMVGQRARDVAEALQPLPAAEAAGRIRRYVAALWPSLRAEDGAWSQADVRGVPSTTVSVRVGGLEGLQGALPSLALPELAALPAPSDLEARSVPVVLGPGLDSLSLTLALPPDLCAPAAADEGVGNAAGRFARRVRVSGRSLTLEHDSEIGQRWYEPSELPALREVALAAHRAQRRRLRLDCSP